MISKVNINSASSDLTSCVITDSFTNTLYVDGFVQHVSVTRYCAASFRGTSTLGDTVCVRTAKGTCTVGSDEV